jgi:hypothetical protein
MIMRKCGRSVARRRAPEPIRAILWALAIAIVLESVASLATIVAHSRSREPILLASASDVPCSLIGGGDSHAPAHRADDALCCVLCALRDADDAPFSNMTHFEEMLALEGSPSQRRVHIFVLVFRPAEGWGSSWSSRAPPVFS